MRPSSPLGSPPSTFLHVAPASVDRWTALSGPPSIAVHTCRRRCQEDAIRTSGLRGSSHTSLTPVRSLIGEHARPGLPAVGRLVEAAVAAVAPERALRGHVDDARVARVDDDPADVLGVLEPDVLPGLAAVGRLVHAVAVAHAALRVVLAGAHPDRQRIPGVDRHAADRVRRLRVEDGRERDAPVGRAPHAAGGDAHEVGGRPRRDRDVADAPRHDGGPDRAERETREGVGRHRVLDRGGRLVLFLLLRWSGDSGGGQQQRSECPHPGLSLVRKAPNTITGGTRRPWRTFQG